MQTATGDRIAQTMRQKLQKINKRNGQIQKLQKKNKTEKYLLFSGL